LPALVRDLYTGLGLLQYDGIPSNNSVIRTFVSTDDNPKRVETCCYVYIVLNKTLIELIYIYIFIFIILKQEHKLRVFENRVLRRIFGPKRDGVTGGWRKLYNEELHNLYTSPSIIRII
jgi:hypothetical protein